MGAILLALFETYTSSPAILVIAYGTKAKPSDKTETTKTATRQPFFLLRYEKIIHTTANAANPKVNARNKFIVR